VEVACNKAAKQSVFIVKGLRKLAGEQGISFGRVILNLNTLWEYAEREKTLWKVGLFGLFIQS
jgi:hypothetical protein